MYVAPRSAPATSIFPENQQGLFSGAVYAIFSSPENRNEAMASDMFVCMCITYVLAVYVCV